MVDTSPASPRSQRLSHQGHELIAAGLLILAGVTDRGLVADAVRVGYERAKGSLEGYDPSG